MSIIHFRPLRPSDESLFYTMSEEFYHSSAVLHPIPSENHCAVFREMMTSDRYLAGYLLEMDGNAAGFAVTNRMMQHEMGGIVLWVEELYIRPDYRSHGLGSQFLVWLEETMRGKVAAMRLEVEPENERAHALYARLGYQDLGYQQMLKQFN